MSDESAQKCNITSVYAVLAGPVESQTYLVVALDDEAEVIKLVKSLTGQTEIKVKIVNNDFGLNFGDHKEIIMPVNSGEFLKRFDDIL